MVSTPWSEILGGYIANSPLIRRIVAAVQYYCDPKAASESSAEEESREGRSHRRGNEVFDAAAEGHMGSTAMAPPHLGLTEHDLEVYKKGQEYS